MKLIKDYMVLGALLLLGGVGFGQESLGDIPYRTEQRESGIDKNSINHPERTERADDIIYLYDTLELPIIDEFTRFKIKIFPKSIDHPSVFDSSSYLFRANGLYVDTLKYSLFPARNIIAVPGGGTQIDTVDSIRIDFYTDTLSDFIITNSVFVHRPYDLFTQNGVTRRIEKAIDSTLINKSKAHYFARDDGYSYWISRGPFWNRTMGIDPPTLGVMTFDGLDSNGMPYDNSSKLTYGIADHFESKPINLFGKNVNGQIVRYGSNDSIFLSFFYQPHGYGDRPEPDDSLILEFYTPITDSWHHIWSSAGDTLKDFKEVYLHLKDSTYLQEGFRFRFKNYATLSGNFDHWHIDYIRLQKHSGTGFPKEDIQDFAITQPIRTTLKEYTSMPWEHYKQNTWNYTGDTILLHMRNLSSKPDISEAKYQVFRGADVNSRFISQTVQNPNVLANDDYQIPLPLKGQPNNFTFPTDDEERQWFRVVSQTFSSNDLLRENDTLIHLQLFDRYYSYDDFSAEKTYHLNLVGTKVVVEFETPIEDTLRGILVNFVETFEEISNHKVSMVVYNSLNGAPLYESGPIDVVKTPAGRFHRYVLPNDIIVNGKFYIGWEQQDQNKTFVGYDVNYNNLNRTYISEISGSWKKTIFQGTIMIRADFGNGSEDPLSEKEQTLMPVRNTVNFYPNPAKNYVNVTSDNLELDIHVFDLQGKLVLRQFAISNRIDLSNLKNGFYLIRAKDSAGQIHTQKLIISK